eukprot:SAG11_NODE_47_length_20431_cov_7.472752_18_plen_97_part_00
MAVEGRRTVVAWVSAAFTSQSLLQDLTLGPDNQLRQAFVPELQMLRNGAPKPVVRVRYLNLALFLNHAYYAQRTLDASVLPSISGPFRSPEPTCFC